MILKLKDGNVKIELYPNEAPNHVERIKKLANDGKYDNVVFHRVIDGFMDEFAVWTTELSAAAVADIYTTGASVDLTSATGDYSAQGSLKVYYKMNEGTGTVVQDSTSNDLDIDFNSGDPTWALGRL